MADEGLKLTSFYSAPICSASRAQVQTGCYSARVSVIGAFPPNSAEGLNPKEHTVAKLLKEQGYTTMCIGKWHLGDQPEFFPLKFGFDHYFGLPYSNDMIRKDTATGKMVVPLMRDNQVISLWSQNDQDQMARLYTEEAVKFIKENKDHPFYLYLAHNAVHVPIHPGPEFRGHSGHGGYYDWVEEVDWSAGQVLNTLRELHLETNTLVFFTSDNGPWLKQGTNAGSAYPLYGGKGSTWEGGLRESTIAWWPGHVPAGKVTDAVMGEIDLLPTFVSLAGGTVPTDRVIDGADASKLLLGQSEVSPREAHYYYWRYDLQAVRSGPWKLALRPQAYSMSINTGGVKTPGLRLYNLDTDIGERTNVATQFPVVVARLKALADKEGAALCDGSKDGPGVRPPGRVANPKPLYPMANDNKGKSNGDAH
jgi:arylsulfatase A